MAAEGALAHLIHVRRCLFPGSGKRRLVLQPLYSCRLSRNPELRLSALAAVPSRPLSGKHLADLTSSGRDRWIRDTAAAAVTPEHRWNLLSSLQSDLPRAAVVRFVRSQEAVPFFRAMTGTDAQYARLFVESLPGCRTWGLFSALLQSDAKKAERSSISPLY